MAKSSLRLGLLLGAAVIALQAGSALAATPATKLPNILRAPFNVNELQARGVVDVAPPLVCKTASPTMTLDVDLTGIESRYAAGDKTRSTADAAKEAEYEARVAPVRSFLSYINRIGDRFIAAKNIRSDYADCVTKLLADAADKKGLSKIDSHQGLVVQAWNLAGLSTTYLKVRDHGTIPVDRRAKIERFLLGLAQNVKRDFENAPTDKNATFNNHRYWAGYAVAITGVVVNNQDLFNFGVNSFRIGVNEITADGFLPRELARGSRALGYHNFALQPLMAMAHLGEVNGLPLTTERQLNIVDPATKKVVRTQSALQRALLRLMFEVKTNGQKITELNGTVQTPVAPAALSMVPVALKEFGAKTIETKKRDKKGKMVTSRRQVVSGLGTSVQGLFGGALPASFPNGYLGGDQALLFPKK